MKLLDIKKIRVAIIAGEPEGSYNRKLTTGISRSINDLFEDLAAQGGHEPDFDLFLETELVTDPDGIKTQMDEALYGIYKRFEKLEQTPVAIEAMKYIAG